MFQTQKQLQLYLLQLFHNERRIKEFTAEIDDKQKDMDKTKKKQDKIEEELKEKRKEHAKLAKDLNKVEQLIHEMVRLFRYVDRWLPLMQPSILDLGSRTDKEASKLRESRRKRPSFDQETGGSQQILGQRPKECRTSAKSNR